jgi:serine/threonine-protein kinase
MAMAASVRDLVDRIRRSKLLKRAQFTQLVHDLQFRFPDPKTLTHQLLARSWLTPYQADYLLTGQGAGLYLGHYCLLDRLGEGGMGQVYKARHQNLGRMVAVKVIRKELLAHPDSLRRFRREIKAASKLSHPNVVLAFDADEVRGVHYFAMEFVPGTDLFRMVRTSGPLLPGPACEYIRQAALGLQHAHERGIVHRDIKPHNLLVVAANDSTLPMVKVLDMGLARLALPEDELSALSHSDAVIGTPDYMAPEQAKHPKVDHRADIYALGCTMYYALTGRVPFPGGSSIEKLLHHQMDRPIPVAQFRGDVPGAVLEVLDRMMAKRPEQRFQSAAAVAVALAPFCPAVRNGTLRPIVGGRRARARRSVWGTILTGLLVVAVAATWYFTYPLFSNPAASPPQTTTVGTPSRPSGPPSTSRPSGTMPTKKAANKS